MGPGKHKGDVLTAQPLYTMRPLLWILWICPCVYSLGAISGGKILNLFRPFSTQYRLS